ncbi:Zinc finger, C2H2 type domain containing protein [Moelleriella libera RCEF 2490]|uniref:Zinc finger, C2H2 type domain containing protein n=1 Tax=Moelleriella libera RCEF 2490 TaxID=1081109 RepID=A0A168D6S3_9HYPO|nr:Zinc finger, C2H2 type domain containing protein [Moelleriella libera RCEF 2490]
MSAPRKRSSRVQCQLRPSWVTSTEAEMPPSLSVGQGNVCSTYPPHLSEPSGVVDFADAVYDPAIQMTQSSFATWLFDPEPTLNGNNSTSLPFLDEGIEFTLNEPVNSHQGPLGTSSSLKGDFYEDVESSNCGLTKSRSQEIRLWLQSVQRKQLQQDVRNPTTEQNSPEAMPALDSNMFEACLQEFWHIVSPRLPIVHQQTFSPNGCPLLLLLVMISLGAASLRSRDMTDRLRGYRFSTDVIICNVRWEILISDGSSPPIVLWVAQALLLVELYEKLYSTRRFHERAHVFHSAYMTLLRRGNPLTGNKAESEMSENPNVPFSASKLPTLYKSMDPRAWWVHWAETESMIRVVYAAFMLDIVHAVMFSHAADMVAHEIRLPLPCDDSLWTSTSPEAVRQLEASFRMYGVKQISFLDGLKSALHGKEVKTHAFGRMIVMAGLLSVEWHLSHREVHLKSLDLRGSSTETQHRWRRMLLAAFDCWKGSFDAAMSDSVQEGPGHGPSPNGPINSASLLFHLAHISVYADIGDCQILAGIRRLTGRQVSSEDYMNAVRRTGNWARQMTTRHAVLHAFRLLCVVMVDGQGSTKASPFAPPIIRYSIRNEIDPHRPWIMYLAVLVIWAFVQAVPSGRRFPISCGAGPQDKNARTARYLSAVAALPDLDDATVMTLHAGLPELLEVTEAILQEASAELLVEARHRLAYCRETLLSGCVP